jgi:hypothetical protein
MEQRVQRLFNSTDMKIESANMTNAGGQPRDPSANEEESRRILSRVASESTTIGRSAMEQAGRHFSAADAPQSDRIEVWGKRIGRLLALAFAIWAIARIATHFAR